MNLQKSSNKSSSTYWVFEDRDKKLDKASTEELKHELERSGLKVHSPSLGGVAPSEAIPQIYALVFSLNEPWKTLMIGILASRIDRLFSYCFQWYKKQKVLQSNNDVQYVLGIWIYRKDLIGRNRTIHLRLPLDKPLSKRDIKKILNSKK